MAFIRAVDLDLFHAGNGWKLRQAVVADTVSNVHFSTYRRSTGNGGGDGLRFASGRGL